jgi:hypothetical protein
VVSTTIVAWRAGKIPPASTGLGESEAIIPKSLIQLVIIRSLEENDGFVLPVVVENSRPMIVESPFRGKTALLFND